MKVFYRNTFACMKPFIKFRPFLDKVGIKAANFSAFMSGDDSAVKEDRLNELLLCLDTYINMSELYRDLSEKIA